MNQPANKLQGPIGIFDSGYGGLTIFEKIRHLLPEYDYIYLGDNARTPYGTRSFEVVYEFTRQAVSKLFALGCPLVILACNTASAKALRTIQQIDLPQINPQNRVLGIIRPTVEALGKMTTTNHVGLLATDGTIRSESYPIEAAKLFPKVRIVGQACPMWVPLVENGEYNTPGADYFVEKKLNELFSRDSQIDSLILGCTHYPLLIKNIRKFVSPDVKIIGQGSLVASSLEDYLDRHPEMEKRISRNGESHFLTTESPEKFKDSASIFLHHPIEVERIMLG